METSRDMTGTRKSDFRDSSGHVIQLPYLSNPSQLLFTVSNKPHDFSQSAYKCIACGVFIVKFIVALMVSFITYGAYNVNSLKWFEVNSLGPKSL